MKLALLSVLITSSNLPMDPKFDTSHLPKNVRDSFHEAMKAAERAQLDVREAVKDAKISRYQSEIKDGVIHKRHSKEHSSIDIHATMTDSQGKETVFEVKQDGTLEKSGDTSGNNESNNSTGYTTRYVAVTNGLTAIITGAIGAGVALAVKFGTCKK